MNSQTRKKKKKRKKKSQPKKKTAGSAEDIYAMKSILKTKTFKITFTTFPVILFNVIPRKLHYERVTPSEERELGTMSKKNLRDNLK